MDVSEPNRNTVDAYSGVDEAFLEAWGDEGGFERRLLLNPTIFRLLGDVSQRRVLDAGCGTGYLSRLLARRGADVIGVEPADGPFRFASRLERERNQGVSYLQRDLSALGEIGEQVDAVVANMVFLDIPDWKPALANCVRVLRPGGTLVYSLHHPVWVPGRFEDWAAKGHVEVTEYLNDYEQRGGVATNFHRPLSAYVNETIRLGCELAELVEPRLRADQVENPEHEIFTRIPNFVVVAATKR